MANGHGGEAGDDVEHSNEQNEGQTEGAKASHQSSAVVVFDVVKMICLGINRQNMLCNYLIIYSCNMYNIYIYKILKYVYIYMIHVHIQYT